MMGEFLYKPKVLKLHFAVSARELGTHPYKGTEGICRGHPSGKSKPSGEGRPCVHARMINTEPPKSEESWKNWAILHLAIRDTKGYSIDSKKGNMPT